MLTKIEVLKKPVLLLRAGFFVILNSEVGG